MLVLWMAFRGGSGARKTCSGAMYHAEPAICCRLFSDCIFEGIAENNKLSGFVW